ncbi:MAG: WbqC family protein [Candidatus Rokubacteria bacterium]|nr:WbqC family protein [Candidatus Rokubacteria bacterium]MBI3827528.1 WbqC family protein [Candidatus Rokubacteria bacterium]
MKIAIHQPHYLPWLGYLAKWAAADLFVFLDTVQYEKNGWQNRNRIKTPQGARWLTVPVRARLGMPIADVAVDTEQPWPRRHWRAVEHAYARAPAFGAHGAALRGLYARPWPRLAPLAAASAEWLARAAGIAVPVVAASTLGVTETDATGRLVSICRAVGAGTYLAGQEGATYMDLAHFREAGIEVWRQRYEHPRYPQLHGEFVPFLSGLDLLLTHGDASLGILRRGDAWTRPSP